jgi:hypothetical protein
MITIFPQFFDSHLPGIAIFHISCQGEGDRKPPRKTGENHGKKYGQYSLHGLFEWENQ